MQNLKTSQLRWKAAKITKIKPNKILLLSLKQIFSLKKSLQLKSVYDLSTFSLNHGSFVPGSHKEKSQNPKQNF